MPLTDAPLDLPQDNIVDIDLGGEDLRQNWRTLLPQWTSRPPIYVINNDVPQVLCVRYCDVHEVFNDRTRFTVKVPKGPGNERFDLFMGVEDVAHMDGADHDRVRALLAPAFGPASIQRLDTAIIATVNQLLDEIEAQGSEFDAMRQFASQLIARIVLNGMFQMSLKQQEAFMRMHDAFRLTLSIKPGQPFPVEYLEAFEGARDTIKTIIQERRAHPGPDMISDIVNAKENGVQLSDEELFANIFSISAASLGTTANAMGAVLIALCSNPEQMTLLRYDNDLIPQAIEEAMRFGIGLLSFTRFATQDTEVGGTKIYKGMPVHLSRQGANLDPAQFPNPLRFDIARNSKQSLVFGAGPHRCIGFRLGRLVMRRSLEGLLQRFPNLQFAQRDFKPVYGGMFGELKPLALPLRTHS